MANLGSVPGRIPQIDVRIGDPAELFSLNTEEKPGDFFFTVYWYDALNNQIDPDGGNKLTLTRFEKFEEGGCVTFSHRNEVENTRIYPYTGSAYGYSFIGGPDSSLTEYVAEYNKGHYGQLDSPPLYNTYAPGFTTGVHNFVTSDTFDLHVVSQGNNTLGYIVDQTQAIYSEVFPMRHPQVVRIAQEYDIPWARGKLILADKTISNPSFSIEIETKNMPRDQLAFFTQEYTVYSAVTRKPIGKETIKVDKPTFYITIGEGCHPSKKITFIFPSGQKPVAITNGDEAVLGEEQTIPKFGARTRIDLDFQFVPLLNGNEYSGGYYKVDCNLFKKPWLVKFNKVITETTPLGVLKSEKTIKPIHIPPASISMTFIGMGVFTFAYGPYRYDKTAVAQFSRNLNRSADNVENVDLKTRAIYNKDYITMSAQYTDAVDMGTGSSLHGLISAISTNNLYTPYIYKTTGYINPKENIPTFNPESVVGVRKITLTPKVENTYLIRTTGSIELTNFVGLWDKVAGVKGITIDFRYMDEESWQRIFTGFMISPSHTRPQYGTKYVTFDLVDRMYVLERLRIINSPYFDGTRWIDSFKSILKYAGWRDNEIVVGDSFTSNKQYNEYNMPFAPNYLQNPQFRFPFGTDFMTILKEFHKLLRTPIWCDYDGKIRIESPVFLRDNTEIFNYYADANEAEEDEHYNIISQPVYKKDTDSMYNIFVAGGPNFETKDSTSFGTMSLLTDIESLTNPDAFNYLATQVYFTLFKIWLCSPKDIQAYVRLMYETARYPMETVSWSNPYYHRRMLYTPIKFVDTTGVIPNVYNDPNDELEEKDLVFYLLGNEFNFDSSRLSASSRLQANIVRGMKLI